MHHCPRARRAHVSPFALLLLAPLFLSSPAHAQEGIAPAVVDEGAGFGVRAELWPAEVAPGELCELRVVVTPAKGRHVYARTQPKGFDMGVPLELELEAEGLEIVGDWSESFPQRKDDADLGVSYDVHKATAVLARKLRAPKDLTAAKRFTVKGKATGMSCDDSGCLPISTLAFHSELAVLPELGTPMPKIDAKIGWGSLAKLHANEAAPGAEVWLSVYLATPSPRHVYAMHKTSESGYPTKIELELPEGVTLAGPIGEPTPIEKEEPGLGETLYYHEGRVRFFVPVKIAADAKPGERTLRVHVEAMSCDDEGCLPPSKQSHEVKLTVKGA
jgi:DsbC/DsbD-like thiol-disulfide interchange protein